MYPYIDINRVGIYGHSGGGFMSTAALLTYPDFYDVAVSSSGNHDNNIYNQWWGETHDGVEEVDKKIKHKEGETDDSIKVTFKAEIEKNQDLAKNLKGYLLLVTGDIDDNVHPGNTIRVADALIKANKRFDFMVMPGQRHGYGEYAVYFERMMWYYFAEHLLDDYRTNVGLYDYMGKMIFISVHYNKESRRLSIIIRDSPFQITIKTLLQLPAPAKAWLSRPKE